MPDSGGADEAPAGSVPGSAKSSAKSRKSYHSRRSSGAKPGVEINNSDDEECTLIRVACEDRPGLLLDLTEHLKAQQLTIVKAVVTTEGMLAVDIFHVKDIGTDSKISESRIALLKDSLERLCAGVQEDTVQDDAWELNQHLGDTATLRVHMMSREQWEIDRNALEIDEDACLGRGSFGEVHKGYWRGTLVAVKRLREDVANDRELLEFRRELAIVNHLAHPNIVQFLGAVTNSMPLCIVTEFLPGGNVADVLAARGDDNPLPVGKALRWSHDTTLGMRYLHERRPTMIIHRDLKPENLLLDASNRVKITDFGLSKSAMQLRGERLGHGEEQTVSRTTCGTWLYTAPEVFRKEPYTAKVDQFAFAMILYELLMGTTPFRGLPAEEATVQLALGHRPAFKRPITPELKQLIEASWHQDPTTRPTFIEIQRVLYNALAALPKSAFEEGVGQAVRRASQALTSSVRNRGSSASRKGMSSEPVQTQAEPACGCVIA